MDKETTFSSWFGDLEVDILLSNARVLVLSWKKCKKSISFSNFIEVMLLYSWISSTCFGWYLVFLKKKLAYSSVNRRLKIYKKYQHLIEYLKSVINRPSRRRIVACQNCILYFGAPGIDTGWVNKNARRLKKSCSLNIKAMILRIVLFYPRYVKLCSVIHPALIGHSFPSK